MDDRSELFDTSLGILLLVKSKPYATEELWSCHRKTITRLYQDERRPLKEVMQIMERNYFFIATERMFKTRIKRWGLDKKFKEAEVLQMLHLKRQRGAAGKESRFIIRNQDVDWEGVVRYLKRRPDLQRQFDAGDPHQQEGCLEIICRTPSPVNTPLSLDLPEPNTEMRLQDEILRLVGGYLDGVFEAQPSVVEGQNVHRRLSDRGTMLSWLTLMDAGEYFLNIGKEKLAFGLFNSALDKLGRMVLDEDPLVLSCWEVYTL